MMNREQHKQEIAEIKKHVKMLNITGGIAIGALALAGFLMVTDIFSDSAETEPYTADATELPADEALAVNQPQKILPNLEEPVISDPKPEPAIEKTGAPGETKTPMEAPQKEMMQPFSQELQRFEASCSNGSLTFNWTTVGGSKYNYEIEKSDDRVNFEVFARAPQPEKIDGLNRYHVEETGDFNSEVYFRLRKVVGKGKFEYSEIIPVNCGDNAASQASVDVYPNGNGSFRIIINAPRDGAYTVTIVDAAQNEIITEEYQARSGNNEFVLSSDNINRGNYTLRVSGDNTVKEKKVVMK